MHCNGEEDGNEDNREVKANGGAGAHVDGGGDFAGERGGGEQGGWKTCANMCNVHSYDGFNRDTKPKYPEACCLPCRRRKKKRRPAQMSSVHVRRR